MRAFAGRKCVPSWSVPPPKRNASSYQSSTPLCPKQLISYVRGRCQAAPEGNESHFDEKQYLSASINGVWLQGSNGPVICLRIDSRGSYLPVYVGEPEARALLNGMANTPPARPLTHDLMKSALECAGFQVTLVRITALVGNTYHARMHICKSNDASSVSVNVDARPSDAINMAVRFRAPIYISREVASKMAVSASEEVSSSNSTRGTSSLSESESDIVKSCKEECRMYRDPTVMEHLQLQLAVEEERYEEASQLRDKIDRLMQSDRAMSLVVAIETALEDKRYQEAARLRDELQQLRTVRYYQSE